MKLKLIVTTLQEFTVQWAVEKAAYMKDQSHTV